MQKNCYTPYSDINQYCEQAFKGSFADYITFTREHIKKIRLKAGVLATDDIIDMNAPFSHQGKGFDGQRGILLIPGFLGSPYIMRSLAAFYEQQGFLVRCIILPGHGTVPGDLLRTRLKHWHKAVEFGIKSLQKEVKEVHLCGFSIGASLGLYQCTRHSITSMTAIAPALGITHMAAILNWLSKAILLQISPKKPWVVKRKENHIIAYQSFPAIAAVQIHQLIHQLHRQLKRQPFDTPTFFALSTEDLTVKPPHALKFFRATTNKNNQCLVYSRKPLEFSDPRITLIRSDQLADNVLDLSHIALPVSPDDPMLGANGSHYPDITTETCFGEWLPENVIKPHFKRLTYHPEFSQMTDNIAVFLAQHR